GAAAQDACDGSDDVVGLGEAAGPDVAAGQAADAGGNDVHAAALEQGDVVLHGRVLPHLGVHGGAHHDRGSGGDQGVEEQVLADAGGVEADHPGGGGSHQHEVSGLAEVRVRDGALLVPERRPGPLGAEGVEGGATDEV